MLQKVAIGKLRPNPFRRLDEYPIEREKVEALKSSIENSGFWKTIVGRPAKDGSVEVAFGHHRLVALQELFGPDETVEILVQDITNENMLRMMANENMAEWGSDGWVEVETVRATIEAARKGLIKIEEKRKGSTVINDSQDSVNHSRSLIGKFLGWTRVASNGNVQPNNRCEIAFDAIEAIDSGLVKPADLRGLARYKIQELIRGIKKIQAAELEAARRMEDEARAAQDEREAEILRRQAKQHREDAESRPREFVGKGRSILENGRKGLEEFRETVRSAAHAALPKQTKVHTADEFFGRLAVKLERLFNGDDDLSGDVEFAKEIWLDASPKALSGLRDSLASLRDRVEALVSEFHSDNWA
jgi:hypothetical protein